MIAPEPQRDLVLAGGGHTHVLALRRLMMNAPKGLRLTLVSESDHAPYSGMLPGLIAGHYTRDDVHIDLRRLCGWYGVRFVRATVTGVDVESRRLKLAGRPELGFDILSVNVGARPDTQSVPGAAEHTVPVKPVSSFCQRWQALEERLSGAGQGAPENLIVVGGGAGGVEITLAAAHRLRDHAVRIVLACEGEVLAGYNRIARRAARRALADYGVELLEHGRVERIDPGSLELEAGGTLEFDELLWCTGAVAPDWLAGSGLPVNGQGFLIVGDTLEIKGCEDIFAAGDCAVQPDHPRPRAGVYAVRQAPVLADNLRSRFTGGRLRKYRPQHRFLSLLSLGGKRAVADRGRFGAEGVMVWHWKDHIDRRFMNKFTQKPGPMRTRPVRDAGDARMRCGGCGAKLPAHLLRDALAAASVCYPDAVQPGGFRDDAATVDLPEDATLVQTTDTLRSLVDDPWIMGRLAALHALGDIHAMGADPHSCLMQVTVRHGASQIQARDMRQLMLGALCEFNRVNCRLAGGHSLEGPDLQLGFTVNGICVGHPLLPKQGGQPGDELVLTRPLGTGVIFAAHMAGAARGEVVHKAIESMLQGNAPAAAIARKHATACTDVTGFGLLGHLLEMLTGRTGVAAELSAADIPLLDGALELFRQGYASTLAPANLESVRRQVDTAPAVEAEVSMALTDPQTCGGLLMTVPAERVSLVIDEFAAAGCYTAARIGAIILPAASGAWVRVI